MLATGVLMSALYALPMMHPTVPASTMMNMSALPSSTNHYGTTR
jgi:hypothetical protein